MDVKSLTITPDSSIHDAVATIDRGGKQIALVVDAQGRLLATVTDGDVRRGILRGLDLAQPVQEVMNASPLTVSESADISARRLLMQTHDLQHIPVVDDAGQLVELAWINDIVSAAPRSSRVFLMAGGLGTRLRPLTESVPKPMLPVGGRPILELILRSLVDQGFSNISISVNYLGDMIKSYFGNGHGFGADIEYIDETERMGTAGALSLLPTTPTEPMIVMNADLLTAVQFQSMIDFHNDSGALATMGAREHVMQVPYGVLKTEGVHLKSIEEKPSSRHLVNAGIYVISPQAMEHLTPGAALDMPDFFERLMAQKEGAAVYPIREYWMDIGRPEDLERAQSAVLDVFK
ncbi:MAG: nucleotidyltransferase family protein [Pelagimonas sp.]|jgi:dTDP-glucose pyrophosphorylase|nr:nucleotidyltransferase family protein [Pelagimonas sp.]